MSLQKRIRFRQSGKEVMFQKKDYKRMAFGKSRPMSVFPRVDAAMEGDFPETAISFFECVYEDTSDMLMDCEVSGELSGVNDIDTILWEGFSVPNEHKMRDMENGISKNSLIYLETHAKHQIVLAEIADCIQGCLHLKRIGEQMYYYCNIVWKKLMDGENLRAITDDILDVHDMLNRSQFAEIYNILKGRVHGFEVLDVESLELQFKVNFKNGVYDLREDTMQPHSPEYAFVSFIPYDFYVGELGRGSVFEDYLESISLGNSAVRKRILQWIAYSVSNLPNIKKIALLLGERDSGKTTLALLMSIIVGQENVQSFSFDNITRFSKDAMFGKKVGLCTDLKGSRLSAESMEWLKNQTGGDFVHADVKHNRQTYSYISKCKYIIASNFRPDLGNDDALENRFLVIPFPKSIPEEQKNYNLLHDIKQELQHIFYIAFEALREFLDDGMQFADIGEWENYTPNFYSNQQDDIANFFRECCCLDKNGIVSRTEMYNAFCDYAKEQGFQDMSKAKFYRGFRKIAQESGIRDDTNAGRRYKGVSINPIEKQGYFS